MISLTSPVETRAHGWPAGAKLGALCVATVVLFAVRDVAWHVAFLLGMVALYAAPGLAFLRAGLQRLKMLWMFVAMIVGWHWFTGDLEKGAVIGLRMVTAVGLSNLVTMTTSLEGFMGVVRWLTAPLKWLGVNTRAIELAVALVVRFTPVLADKGILLTQSWRARATRKPGWRIVLPFMVLAIDDAEQVAEALRARGGL